MEKYADKRSYILWQKQKEDRQHAIYVQSLKEACQKSHLHQYAQNQKEIY